MFEKKLPPVAIVEKYISEFYTADIFHRGNVYKNKVNFKEVFAAEHGLIYRYSVLIGKENKNGAR